MNCENISYNSSIFGKYAHGIEIGKFIEEIPSIEIPIARA